MGFREADIDNVKIETSNETIQNKFKTVYCKVNHVQSFNETYKVLFTTLNRDVKMDHITLRKGEKLTISSKIENVDELLSKDSNIECFGNWIEHPKYGLQFESYYVQPAPDFSPMALKEFLSKNFDYIGAKNANLIVNAFGDKTLDVLDNTPEEIKNIKGIGEKRSNAIIEGWKKHREIYDLIEFLLSRNITNSVAFKIYNKYKNECLNIINNEPYKIIEIDGIGFKTADDLALSVGIARESDVRIRQAINYVVDFLSTKEGNTGIKTNLLSKKVYNLIGVKTDLIEAEILKMLDNQELIKREVEVKEVEVINKEQRFTYKKHEIYSTRMLVNLEKKIARLLKHIHSNPTKLVEDEIDLSGYVLDNSQRKAIETCLTNKVSILTGGPGTGKTYTIKNMINYLEKLNLNIVLAAPTGRAAKRIEETSGREATTIHRLLEFNGKEFQYNEMNKLTGDVFIIDESSMIDTFLARNLLEAIPDYATIIFVGDADQIPSVSCGNFLNDLILSKNIAVARLGEVHRTSEHSKIVPNAHKVNKMEMPDITNASGTDFFFIESNNDDEIMFKMGKILNLLKSKDINLDNVQILSPQMEKHVGTDNINNTLQVFFNPNFINHTRDEKEINYCVGDRIIQLKNNYEKNIFNGDVGKVLLVDHVKKLLKVDFGNNHIVDIAKGEFFDIKLAYAITVHKSQGSEYPYVIIPLSESHLFSWNNNLLYTGITRTKEKIYLVGTKKALYHAVKNLNKEFRVTGLVNELNNRFSLNDDFIFMKKPETLTDALPPIDNKNCIKTVKNDFDLPF